MAMLSSDEANMLSVSQSDWIWLVLMLAWYARYKYAPEKSFRLDSSGFKKEPCFDLMPRDLPEAGGAFVACLLTTATTSQPSVSVKPT